MMKEKTQTHTVKSKTNNKFAFSLFSITLIALIGFLQFTSKGQLTFSYFYAIPVAILTWQYSKIVGIFTSIICASCYVYISYLINPNYQTTILIANALIQVIFFITVSWFVCKLKNSFEQEQSMARVDFLTGALNNREFMTILNVEIERAWRYKHPFALVYFDLDNFKTVNDQFGHSAGDMLLEMVVSHIKHSLRRTDTIARLGGDEFAILLPETNEQSAQIVVEKLQSGLKKLMSEQNWPVTFSMGIVIYNQKQTSAAALLEMADSLMYEVKHDQKDSFKMSTLEPDNMNSPH